MDSAQPNSPGEELVDDLLAVRDGACLPNWVEEHFAREREGWRLVRRIGEE